MAFSSPTHPRQKTPKKTFRTPKERQKKRGGEGGLGPVEPGGPPEGRQVGKFSFTFVSRAFSVIKF